MTAPVSESYCDWKWNAIVCGASFATTSFVIKGFYPLVSSAMANLSCEARLAVTATIVTGATAATIIGICFDSCRSQRNREHQSGTTV